MDLGANNASFKTCSLIAYPVLWIWQVISLCSQGALNRRSKEIIKCGMLRRWKRKDLGEYIEGLITQTYGQW